MLNGYGGSILRVDLSTGKITKEPTPPQLARDFIGGRGFGAYFLYQRSPQKCRPPGAGKQADHLQRPLLRAC